MNTLKLCTRCKNEKPATLDYFPPQKYTRDGLSSWCKDCHSAVSNETVKRCTKCKEEKPATLDYFPARKRSRDGLNSWCMVCFLKSDQRKIKDPERFRQRKRATEERFKAQNPEKYREQKRRGNARAKAKDPEKYREQRRAGNARYKAKDPEKYREQRRVADMRRKARKRGLPHTLTKAEWQYTVAWWGGCAYCGVDMGAQDLTLDHVIPLVSPDCPGTTARNVVPACIKCNRIKNRFSVQQFLERNFGQDHAASRLAVIAEFFNTLPDDD